MPQGVLPFQYQGEAMGKGMTGLCGLGVYLDFLYGVGIPRQADPAIGMRRTQGYTDGQMVVALVLLNLAGGEAVQSLEVLAQDEGLMALLRRAETWGHGRRGTEVQRGRWRRERQGTLSPLLPCFATWESSMTRIKRSGVRPRTRPWRSSRPRTASSSH